MPPGPCGPAVWSQTSRIRPLAGQSLDWLRSYVDAGARHLLLRIGSLDLDVQLRTATRLLIELGTWDTQPG